MVNNVLCNCGILRQSSQKLTAIYDEALKSSGLRVTQFAVLKNIHKLGKTSITELDTYLEQDRSTIGRNIRILEKIKVVSINKSSDKREFEILITKYGIECLQLARKSWEEINIKISSKLGKEKQKQMIEIMNVIQSI
ncbi:MarR family winged helix-turn-helix transcriptional regulator [Alphaproteobacteria bacterium]|nr:MarR family winged helix-turn-helix transcriptional regulator [Alphaproteobacteria bacterium]